MLKLLVILASYTFFSASTHRWANLMKSLAGKKRSLTVESLSGDTRWSARADAIEAFVDGDNSIQNALSDIESDMEQTAEARSEARPLGDKMDCLETALLWNIILVRFNRTNKAFQCVDVDLKKVMNLIDSLEMFLKSLRYRYEELELD